MRTFKNLETMINEVTRDLFSRGMEVFDETVQGKKMGKEYRQKELFGYTFKVFSTEDLKEMLEYANKTFKKPHINIDHGEAWFRDMISGKALNPEPSWRFFEDYWKKFGFEADGRFAYTYAERLVYLPQVIEALEKNLFRRGAVITVYNTPQDVGNMGKRRVPCSMYYHFVVRENVITQKIELNLVYTMRSCDFANFFPLDIYRAVRLQQTVAKHLNLEVGSLTYFTSSLHCYHCDVPEERKW